MTARSLPAALIRESFVSISIATLIVLLWLSTAYVSLFMLPDAKTLSAAAVAATIVVRSFLHTGLFILAHDAMHGTLMPAYPKANDWAGRIILRIYSFLSFDMMRECHHQHHRTPAQSTDPDFYLGGFWSWYSIQWCWAWVFPYSTRHCSGYCLRLLAPGSCFTLAPIALTDGQMKAILIFIERIAAMPHRYCRSLAAITSTITGNTTSIRTCLGINCHQCISGSALLVALYWYKKL